MIIPEFECLLAEVYSKPIDEVDEQLIGLFGDSSYSPEIPLRILKGNKNALDQR